MSAALSFAARVGLGATFLWLGALKIADPVAFLKAVRQFGVVADTAPELLTLLAALLPFFEVWCGLLLVLGVAVRGNALLLLALLAVFTFAIFERASGLADATGRPLCEQAFDCGCGSGVVNACGKLGQNAALMLLALLALALRPAGPALRPALFPARS